MYKGYFVDLDGTMYRGNKRIDGAKEFINELRNRGLPYLFITNNSSATQKDVAEKLNQMGIYSKETQIITSAIATAKYIKRQKENAKVYVIGENGLYEALKNEGIEIADTQVDYVVTGIDRDISYEKLAQASLYIQQGATFISTNPDAAIPTERGLLPGNGALTSVLSVCTGVEPIFIGKPKKHIMNEALQIIGLSHEEVLMVGDNYETDILAGIHANIDTLAVLTGFTTKDDVEKVDRKPTYVMNNLVEWLHKRQAKV